MFYFAFILHRSLWVLALFIAHLSQSYLTQAQPNQPPETTSPTALADPATASASQGSGNAGIGSGGAAEGGAVGGKAEPDFLTILLSNPMNYVMVGLVLLWFMVILPQQKAAKNQQNELKNLKKNDRIVTSSGIHGVVLIASADSPTVTIRIDDATNAKLTINRDAIAKVSREEAPEAK